MKWITKMIPSSWAFFFIYFYCMVSLFESVLLCLYCASRSIPSIVGNVVIAAVLQANEIGICVEQIQTTRSYTSHHKCISSLGCFLNYKCKYENQRYLWQCQCVLFEQRWDDLKSSLYGYLMFWYHSRNECLTQSRDRSVKREQRSNWISL